MTNEVWKKTHVSEHYMVSNLGRVKSLTRRVYRKNGSLLKTVRGRILSTFISKTSGYPRVKIVKIHNVHRLVGMAFCGGYFDGAVINHKNGDRSDNRADNLEWCTYSHNSKHGYSHNGRVPVWYGKKSKDHNTSKPVISINSDGSGLVFWHCASDAVRAIGADSGSISRASRYGGIHRGALWFTPDRFFAWSEPSLKAFAEYREAQ